MNKQELLKRKLNKEKICEYTYNFEYGKEEQYKRELDIADIFDNGFTTKTGYGYTLPYECFGEWQTRSWSTACYRHAILLACDDSIENYLPKIRAEIACKIKNQIENLSGYLKKLI